MSDYCFPRKNRIDENIKCEYWNGREWVDMSKLIVPPVDTVELKIRYVTDYYGKKHCIDPLKGESIRQVEEMTLGDNRLIHPTRLRYE